MELVVPPRITPAQIARVRELRLPPSSHRSARMAQVDMFVRNDGEVLVNELNTIPGFTGTVST